ncbi:hypothetical protein BDY17DRAFT_252946 [Neohortaea acidophila]|uniref:Uncharacterized protein n=1 Tax=Neohortaea acidophila TaxID=245834 RepID=A0A6A6PQZ5_9PEZI|nr:uncharacterized protein BDY17DRAFT_252946 [Neohortaea acidophila]KAF2482054.1 hypothetical protein BDY17DRAFT_252946 [Neohortaea acidophila]
MDNEFEEADERWESEPTTDSSREFVVARQHDSRAHRYLHLPDEIIIQIVAHVAQGPCAQQALFTSCLLSRAWYDAAVEPLYRRPQLYGPNFDPFVRAICPSINLHVRKSPLAGLVKALDMSRLVHQGSKTVTARLLGRTKDVLEEFMAPRASFSIHCFPALAKCSKLRTLDLSLVSESPPLPDIFKSISRLTSLRSLKLPRSTGFGVHQKAASFDSCWPPQLVDLTLCGGIDAHFLHGVASFPSTLRSLTIEHCPLARSAAVTHLLRTAVRPLQNLERFQISHMPRLSSHALDDILVLLPQISHLSVSVDYLSPSVFDSARYSNAFSKDPDSPVPLCQPHLRTLELTSTDYSTSISEENLAPIDIIIALDEGTLPGLRRVRVARSLGWDSADVAPDTEALGDALQEGARRDWERKEWVFADMTEEQYSKAAACWESVSGVWVFESA